jgi:hypothetical protein
MWGGLSNRNGRLSLSHMPDAKALHTISFPRLDGGLNIYDLPYRLNANESQDVRNLHWRDGALGCREGQVWLINQEDEGETGYAAYEDLFWDYGFVHVGTELRCFDPAGDPAAYTVLKTGVPAHRGTFFRYGDNLMYKNKGGYYQIGYNVSGATPAAMFPVTDASENEFVPVTYINTNPTTHAGTAYQPENRLSRKRTIWYSAEAGADTYSIPYGSEDNAVSAVTEVTVDGVTQTEGTDYTVVIDALNEEAYVQFTTAPGVPDPFLPNTVHITYETTGTDAYDAVMDCPYAIVYGGDQNLCVVVGGCPAQPNAYFWSGNDAISMNPFYFPMPHYNFAGDTESAITGFGKQQGLLIVLSKRGIGKASFGTTTIGTDRLQIEMPYTAINSRLGCEYPWSIQLVDNNIVYLNGEHGVCYVADSSAAHENNIVEIGKKINGNSIRHGLMYDAQYAGEDGVYSTMYRDQYWIVASGNAYVWDFRLSNASDPVWFLYTNIGGVAFIYHANDLYHLNRHGSVTAMREGVFSDYGGAIFKTYQFATQMMGTYDRLKNVMSVIFVVRSDTGTEADIEYITDYENRKDLTPLAVLRWCLVPRDLRFRFLGTSNFAMVFRRRPMCRHVKHFSMRLTNNEPDQDLSVISAELYYNYQGRQM